MTDTTQFEVTSIITLPGIFHVLSFNMCLYCIVLYCTSTATLPRGDGVAKKHALFVIIIFLLLAFIHSKQLPVVTVARRLYIVVPFFIAVCQGIS